MTEETFERAKRIQEDIQVLKRSSINGVLSIKTFNKWKDWMETIIAELEEDFKNL